MGYVSFYLFFFFWQGKDPAEENKSPPRPDGRDGRDATGRDGVLDGTVIQGGEKRGSNYARAGAVIFVLYFYILFLLIFGFPKEWHKLGVVSTTTIIEQRCIRGRKI